MMQGFTGLPDVTQQPSAGAIGAGGNAATPVVEGAIYLIIANQPFHIKGSAAGTAAAVTDFGPIPAGTLVRARIPAGFKQLSFFNAGAAAMKLSIALEKQ